MAQKSVYLDSTIPSWYFDRRAGFRVYAEATREWWDTERHLYRVLVSDATLAELGRGVYPNKPQVLGLVRNVAVLRVTAAIEEIAEVYMREFVMPRGAAGDAFHLACASLHKVDFLLTWNCEHLANANKRAHIRVVNARLGLYIPEIVTPLELFSEQGGTDGSRRT